MGEDWTWIRIGHVIGRHNRQIIDWVRKWYPRSKYDQILWRLAETWRALLLLPFRVLFALFTLFLLLRHEIKKCRALLFFTHTVITIVKLDGWYEAASIILSATTKFFKRISRLDSRIAHLRIVIIFIKHSQSERCLTLLTILFFFSL